MSVAPASLLHAAADLIEQRGHWRGEHDRAGRLCAATAVMEVTRGSGYERVTFDLMWSFVNQEGYRRISHWNDDQSHTGVVAGIRRLANKVA